MATQDNDLSVATVPEPALDRPWTGSKPGSSRQTGPAHWLDPRAGDP
jgi:hypothetical protein